MKLIKNVDYQCVAASFAMVMDITIEEVFELVGHNGLDKILDGIPVPACYRGFHPQEFVDLMLDEGYSLTMIELDPCMTHGSQIVSHGALLGEDRFYLSLAHGDGVIFGSVEPGNRGHAVAWNAEEQKIYDPRGYTLRWNKDQDFHPKQFFLVQKVAKHG